MLSRNRWENLYKTQLSSDLKEVSGDAFDVKVLNVESAPKYNSWWLWVDFNDSSKRDLIYFHDKDWSTLYYYVKDRQRPDVVHQPGADVQMNDVAEWVNQLAKNTEDFWYIEVPFGNGLQVKVYWGRARLNEEVYEIDDTYITLYDNETNYIYFDPATQAIEKSTSQPEWAVIAEITTSWWEIVWTQYFDDKRAREYAYKLSSDFKIVDNKVEAADYIQNKVESFEINSTTTWDPGSQASVVNVWDALNISLDFTIPQWPQWEQWETGPQWPEWPEWPEWPKWEKWPEGPEWPEWPQWP